MKEIFKKVKGWENYYSVSNKGNVKSLRTNKILKQRKHTQGYVTVCLSIKGVKNYKYIHRLVAETFISDIPNNFVVNHIDGNKVNNIINNLEIISIKDNVLHAMKIGLHNVTGEDSHFSKLKEDQVVRIRERFKNNESLKHLSKKFNVTKATVSRIVNNKIWIGI